MRLRNLTYGQAKKLINVLFVPVCKKSAVINWFFSQVCLDANGKLEEEFTVARFKSEVKNLVQRCQGLETLSESMKEAEARKRESEVSRKKLTRCTKFVPSLKQRNRCNRSRIRKKLSRKKPLPRCVSRWKNELLDQLRDVHQKQVRLIFRYCFRINQFYENF